MMEIHEVVLGQRVVLARGGWLGNVGDVGTVQSFANLKHFHAVAIVMDNGHTCVLHPNDPEQMQVFKVLPMDDPLREDIFKLVDKQFGKGITKYGAPLSQNPKGLTISEMLDYLAEELVDALHYNRMLKRMIEERGEIDGKSKAQSL